MIIEQHFNQMVAIYLSFDVSVVCVTVLLYYEAELLATVWEMQHTTQHTQGGRGINTPTLHMGERVSERERERGGGGRERERERGREGGR